LFRIEYLFKNFNQKLPHLFKNNALNSRPIHLLSANGYLRKFLQIRKIIKSNFRRNTIMKEKVVLAYSGGLDTTALIPWLKETFDYDVVCCCVNCGQGNELDGLDERAKLSGASKLYIEDLVDDFCDNYIMPCVKADAVYENKYLLGTSMARPAIAKRLVDIARKEGAVAICHGATGKGNDQIRFELSIKALAPDIKIIAPWRMTDVWKMQSREDEIEYCKQHGIDLPFDHSHSYSRDCNIWHISHEGLELEDPSLEPNFANMLVLGVTPEEAPDQGEYVTMTFEKGVPTSVNGVQMKVSDVIRKLNELGGKHGIGIVDIVENRVVGMKSRGVYETPGGTILMEAHKQLEELVLDRATMDVKKDMSNRMAQIVYEGKWFTPLREAVQAFVESTQEYVTGEVKFKLYKGNIIKAGTTSPYSLYSESLASFTTGDLYDHHDADGFITLFGLPLKVRAMKMAEMKAEKNSN
jgi:argininosuccinate synthase